jgi:hypothetical protein
MPSTETLELTWHQSLEVTVDVCEESYKMSYPMVRCGEPHVVAENLVNQCVKDSSLCIWWLAPKGYQKIKKSSPATRHGGACGEKRYSSYSFSTSALDGGEWSASRPGRAFTPGESIPGTHCTGGWVGPRAGLDTEDRGKIICPCRWSNPDRPVVQPVVRYYTAWATPAPIKKFTL